MTLLSSSYGDLGEIAAFVPRYANDSKLFSIATRPTLLEIEGWCDQISAIINGYLAQEGFAIPVTNTNSVLIMDYVVNTEVASIIEGVNGGGRLGPNSKEMSKKGRWTVIYEDIEHFIKATVKALELFGEVITSDIAGNIMTRQTDVHGDETFPIFQRKMSGGEHFTNWDKA